ncbi:MAG: helix-turn-helix transcriptional regulator [Verrucomicrobia bacterium]|nr:helix-turn-helix transcriptional regulator [Verrucomicrobiota bacterium]
MKFGEFVKNRRIDAGLTLRSFCREIGMDASNWSKIERGIIPPPQDPAFLAKIACLLGLGDGERVELADSAAVARGQLPSDFQGADILAKLPAFFRAIRGQEYTADDVGRLVERVKKLHQA